MKYLNLYFAFSIAYIVSILLSSCENSNNQKAYILDSIISNSEQVDYEIESQNLNSNLQNSNIKIEYPLLVSQSKDYSKVNELIKSSLEEYIQNMYGDIYSGLTLNMDYSITYCDSSIISIVFKGISNSSDAAHPINILFSFNVDLDKSIKLRLRDIFEVNEMLVESVKLYLAEQSDSETSEYIKKEYTDQELEKLLMDADESESNIFSYITDEKLGISFGVPHALGDYIVVLIDYDKII